MVTLSGGGSVSFFKADITTFTDNLGVTGEIEVVIGDEVVVEFLLIPPSVISDDVTFAMVVPSDEMVDTLPWLVMMDVELVIVMVMMMVEGRTWWPLV